MEEFLKVLAIIFGAFGISFALINLRYIVKGEEFRGSCATNNPMLKDEFGDCSVCGRKPGQECQQPDLPSIPRKS